MEESSSNNKLIIDLLRGIVFKLKWMNLQVINSSNVIQTKLGHPVQGPMVFLRFRKVWSTLYPMLV